MVHILTAMHSEAKPIIEYFRLKKDLSFTLFEHFKSDEISLSITGVGGIKTASIFSYLFSKEKDAFYILIGVCGTKNKGINLGEIFLVNKAIQNDTGKKFYPDIIFAHSLKENSIESFSKVITFENLPDIQGELIDMESAYFLEATQFFLPPHKSQVLKIVSDHLEIKNITKEVISNLISYNLQKIKNIIDSLQELYKDEQKEIILIEEKNFLLKICETLNLTEYMKNELFSLYKIAKIRKNISIDSLKNYLSYKITSKPERKKVYDKLKNSLF